MNRKAISINITRQLWAQCGGYCQNPQCNRWLFADIDEETVSLANVAHIIGHGKAGPRTEYELADFVDKDGISNLIMLCLDCHKIVDELEQKFSVEEIRKWKSEHIRRLTSLFSIPNITNERELLLEINDLLDENRTVFEEYGPFSKRALDGGDVQKIWRRRCLDALLPNNQRIINLIERNKRNFVYPWQLYREMLGYKIHADAFRDNCLLAEKINDYKLFPPEFDYFVKKELGIPIMELEARTGEGLEFRYNTISVFIQQFLANHSFIKEMEEWNKAMLYVTLIDGRNLRVFVTHTYFFTEYTFDKIMVINPNIDAVICSSPNATYTEQAKILCIQQNIGLFKLVEFMGAIRKSAEEFLNYLVNAEKSERFKDFSHILDRLALGNGLEVYLFGSFLRRKIYRDIDIMLVYNEGSTRKDIDDAVDAITRAVREERSKLDFTVCSKIEFLSLKLNNDNRTRVK